MATKAIVTTETTVIRATSRESVKVGDNFFTVEYCEERTVHIDGRASKDKVEEELAKAREDLWNTCNEEVDMQVLEIQRLAKEAKNKGKR